MTVLTGLLEQHVLCCGTASELRGLCHAVAPLSRFF